MATHARKDIWHKLTLAHFAGNPVYFFDTRFLSSKAAALATWSPAKLEATIGPLVEGALGPSDTRYLSENGFYVVFGGFDPFAAQETANEICGDILRHLFGRGDYSAEAVQRLCHQSSVQDLVEDLGVPPPPRRRAQRQIQDEAPVLVGDPLESRKDKPFAKELAELYREHVIADEDDDNFRFWPCWDSQRQRITSFACEIAERLGDGSSATATAKMLSPATTQCRLDVAALAAASKGVRRIARRCEPAFVTVPVHVETLSWTRTRDAYLSVLGQIDPKFLALIALRIEGFAPGANLSLVAEWIARFRPYVRGTSVEIDAELECSHSGLLGLSGFGLTVTNAMRSPTTPHEALVEQVARLKRICNDQKATASVHNVETLPELYLVKAHGVRFISGPVIDSASAMPGPIRPLAFDDIGSGLLRGGDRDSQIQEIENEVQRAILQNIAHAAHPDWKTMRYAGRA